MVYGAGPLWVTWKPDRGRNRFQDDALRFKNDRRARKKAATGILPSAVVRSRRMNTHQEKCKTALDFQWCVALGTQRPVCNTSNSSLVQKVLVAAYLAGGRPLILRR